MFKPINALSIAISLSLVVVMQPQALSGTVGAITSWGWDSYDQVTDTPAGTGFTTIAGGFSHSLALKSDGSIVSWGWDNEDQVSNTPTGNGFTHIAGGLGPQFGVHHPRATHTAVSIAGQHGADVAETFLFQWLGSEVAGLAVRQRVT